MVVNAHFFPVPATGGGAACGGEVEETPVSERVRAAWIETINLTCRNCTTVR